MISRGEKLIRKLCKTLAPDEEVLYNYRPEWLKNPNTGWNLELDLYFPRLKVGIEYNGISHNTLSQEERDKIKQELCEKNGVKLVSVQWMYPAMKVIPRCFGLTYLDVPKTLKRELKKYRPHKSGKFHKFITRKLGYDNLIRAERKWDIDHKKEAEENKLRMKAKGLIS